MADLGSTIVGGAISLVTTVCVTFGLEQLRLWRDARNTAFAFRGAIAALLSIIETRKYLDLIAGIIAHAQQGGQIAPLKVSVRRNYIEVYNRHIEKLGLLAIPLPERISVFYTQVNSLIEDAETANDGKLDNVPQAHLLAWYIEFHELLTDTMALGAQIVEQIQREYPAPKPLKLRFPG